MANPGNNGGPDSTARDDSQWLSEDGDGADVPGGYERTPSGWRRRVANPGGIRDRQTQTIEQHQRRYAEPFAHTQFVAYLHGQEIKFAKNGDVVVSLRVPYEYRDLAIQLTDAFGLPLSVDVELWAPYADAVAEG